MAWTIPDKGEGDNDLQSILFQEQLDVLVAGLTGIDCVLSGLIVAGGADMTPAVAKGAVLSNRTMFAVAAADVTITTADTTNPRIDLIVVTSAGALAVRAGTAAAAPKPPARTTNDVVIAAVYVPANDTAIATSQITDMRVFPSLPVVIHNITTVRTVNTTSAAFSVWATAPVIPNGLLLAGRRLRVRIGGNVLMNSGTGTMRVAVLYGGTTMYNDTSAASVADADRRAFWMDFEIVAQGNADQSVIGHAQIGEIQTLVTAPTTGIGDIWGASAVGEAPTSFSGSAAVDSDAGNQTLDVQVQFSVSNAAVELVIEGTTVELL